MRESGRFYFCGSGDVNTYALFAEHFRTLLIGRGRAGVIIPDTVATSATTAAFFTDLVERGSLQSLYGFKNERFLFPGIEHTVTYALVTIGGRDVRATRMEFCWLAWTIEEMHDPDRRVDLSVDDFRLLNPNTLTCPIFRSRRDAEITKNVYQRVPVLIRECDEEQNAWQAFYLRLIDYGDHAEELKDALACEQLQCRRVGNTWRADGEILLPVMESKLINAYDHRYASYVNDGDVVETTQEPQKLDPTFQATPRYWIRKGVFDAILRKYEYEKQWFLAYRDIARATDSRTVIASAIPRVPASRNLPILGFRAADGRGHELLANLNSLMLDYLARQNVGGTHLAFFLVKQFPIFPPLIYEGSCPWCRQTTISAWILDRVLELSCTSADLTPFARDLGWSGPPFRWDRERRFLLRCELDAAFFHLYLVERGDISHVLESFHVIKQIDERSYGEYRTKRVILEIYDEMARAIEIGEPYQTRLDPPPADPRVAHSAVAATTRGRATS